MDNYIITAHADDGVCQPVGAADSLPEAHRVIRDYLRVADPETLAPEWFAIWGRNQLGQWFNVEEVRA